MVPRGSLSARFGFVVVPVVMVLEEDKRKRNRQAMMTSCTFFLLFITREPPSVLYLRENNLREDIKVMIPARKQIPIAFLESVCVFFEISFEKPEDKNVLIFF